MPDLTQEILAERLGLTAGAVSKIERGDVRLTSDKIGPLVAALGCHPLELYTPLSTEEREALQILRAASPTARARLLQLLRAGRDLDAGPDTRRKTHAA